MAGFHGKLPSHGDFLRRRMSDAFMARWDTWLQHSVHESRSALGESWDAAYRAAPAWRFAMPFGQGLVAGVVLSAEDRVGRKFPLTVLAELTAPASVLSLAAGNQQWFEAVEQLAQSALISGVDGLARLDSSLALLPDPSPPIDNLDLAAWPPTKGGCFPLPDTAVTVTWFAALLETELDREGGGYGAWWTSGAGAEGAIFPPQFWIVSGWPDTGLYARMIGLQVLTKQAPRISTTASLGAAAAAMTLIGSTESLPIEDSTSAVASATQEMPLTTKATLSTYGISALFSHPGKLRRENQDACLDRAEDGFWVVADGLGGLKHGAQASKAVIHAMAALPAGLTLDDWLHESKAALTQVNTQLVAAPLGEETGSTVVAMAIRGDEAAVIWVGDSRLYRSRGGELEQLSKDHSSAAELAADGDGDFADLLSPASELSRAIGADGKLDIDFLRIEVQPDDRYLLCSDGLYAELSQEQLAAELSREGDAATLLTRLTAHILEGRACDNLSGVLVIAPASGVAAE